MTHSPAIRWRTTVAILLAGAALALVGLLTCRTQHGSWTAFAVVDDTAGFSTGTPVWYAGLEVGSIARVEPYPDDKGGVLTLEFRRADVPLRAMDALQPGAVGGVPRGVAALLAGDPAAPPIERGDTLGGSKTELHGRPIRDAIRRAVGEQQARTAEPSVSDSNPGSQGKVSPKR